MVRLVAPRKQKWRHRSPFAQHTYLGVSQQNPESKQPEDPLSEIGTSDYIRVFRQREGAGVTREGTGSFAYLTMRGVGDSHSWKGSGEGLVSPVVVRLPRWKLPDGWDDEAAAALKEGMQGDEVREDVSFAVCLEPCGISSYLHRISCLLSR